LHSIARIRVAGYGERKRKTEPIQAAQSNIFTEYPDARAEEARIGSDPVPASSDSTRQRASLIDRGRVGKLLCPAPPTRPNFERIAQDWEFAVP
jgi:hypothetical protein